MGFGITNKKRVHMRGTENFEIRAWMLPLIMIFDTALYVSSECKIEPWLPFFAPSTMQFPGDSSMSGGKEDLT